MWNYVKRQEVSTDMQKKKIKRAKLLRFKEGTVHTVYNPIMETTKKKGQR